jgi:AcrR family transcriptional regulator
MAPIRYFDAPERDDPEGSGRRGRKKRATAHRIFIAAVDLMQRDGFNGVSIEQICERADIARATFFQHFSSKSALMAIFSDIVRQRIESELAEADLAPLEQLRLIVEHLTRLTNELGPIAPDLLSAFVAEPGGGFRVDDPETGLAELIVRIVKRGQADGAFADHWSAEDVAVSLVSSWAGVSRRHVGMEAGRPCYDIGPLHNILDLFLNGLSSR